MYERHALRSQSQISNTWRCPRCGKVQSLGKYRWRMVGAHKRRVCLECATKEDQRAHAADPAA
jgi:hypothetical protein